MLVCVNQSGRTAFQASDDAIAALITFCGAGIASLNPRDRRQTEPREPGRECPASRTWCVRWLGDRWSPMNSEFAIHLDRVRPLCHCQPTHLPPLPNES